MSASSTGCEVSNPTSDSSGCTIEQNNVQCALCIRVELSGDITSSEPVCLSLAATISSDMCCLPEGHQLVATLSATAVLKYRGTPAMSNVLVCRIMRAVF